MVAPIISPGRHKFWPSDLDLTFDLLLKIFNIGKSLLTKRSPDFNIARKSVTYDMTFHFVPLFLTLYPWHWSLTYFWKSLTLVMQVHESYILFYELINFDETVYFSKLSRSQLTRRNWVHCFMVAVNNSKL